MNETYDEMKTSYEYLLPGALVRVACQPPDDYNLCSHFLDFMVLKDIVSVLKNSTYVEDNLAKSTESRLMRHAKVVVSTLNYCGSTRMSAMKKSTDFIIIDEGIFETDHSMCHFSARL